MLLCIRASPQQRISLELLLRNDHMHVNGVFQPLGAPSLLVTGVLTEPQKLLSARPQICIHRVQDSDQPHPEKSPLIKDSASKLHPKPAT
jgi:hypothetical protein